MQALVSAMRVPWSSLPMDWLFDRPMVSPVQRQACAGVRGRSPAQDFGGFEQRRGRCVTGHCGWHGAEGRRGLISRPSTIAARRLLRCWLREFSRGP